MLPFDHPDHQVSFLQRIFRAEQDVSGLPERLRFDEIDAVFGFVAFALSRIELELHGQFGNAFMIGKRSFVIDLFDFAPSFISLRRGRQGKTSHDVDLIKTRLPA